MSGPRRLPPGAREIVLPNGEKRIELVIDIGLDPATGRRRQSRRRFRTVAEARDAHAALHTAVKAGTHVPRSHETLARASAAWLAGKRNLKASTRAGYEHALEPALIAYGAMPVQRLTKAHVDTLLTALADGSLPRKDGRARRPWSGRTMALSLHVLGQVLEDLVRQGQLPRNVVALVERPRHRAAERQTWTLAEVRQFLGAVSDDRMQVAWLLALYGLRRGEIAGLRWEHVDLDARTLSIVSTRLSVGGKVVTDDPKSAKGRRVLPMTGALVDALRGARRQQATERLKMGAAYEDSGLVVVDEVGRALHPETLSARFDAASAHVGLPRIRLHDARHTCASLMHAAGEPIAVISAWLGHSSAAFTMRTYVHAGEGALQGAADRLDQVFGGRL